MAVLLAACSPSKLSTRELVTRVEPMAVMIQVNTVVEVVSLEMTAEGFTVTKSTQAVYIKGAGVFITGHGHILTAAHLFTTGQITSITAELSSGVNVALEVLAMNPRRDLALAKADVHNSSWATLADPRDVKVGDDVITIGNPYGDLPFSVTRGIVSALYRDFKDGLYNALQVDTPINPGNSGGPLFNYDGKLVGIVSCKIMEADGLSFAVSSGQILEFLVKYRGL
jgi:serine protease Do